MSAAVKDRPPKTANGQPQTSNDSAGGTTATTPLPLWNGMRLPVVLLSAEVNSGKTIFPITTDPACRSFDHAPTVCVWDQEGSAETYVGQLNFEWVDTRLAVMEGIHRQVVKPEDGDPKWRQILLKTPDVNDSPQESLFRAWYISLLQTPRGKYRVGSADTFTPLQDGMVSWLRRHPEAFGRSANQYSSASSMFLWPDAKAMLSYILSVDCRLRFETFFLTVHLKNEWKNSAKTGERIAEGLDVLDKLCTLHLRLDRKAESKKKSAPRLPSAIVMKQRLVKFGASEDDDRPILPPRIPQCTPDAIRAYIANPPDFANLKVDERMPDDSLTDDQKLRLQTEISENNRATAELEVQAEAAKMTRLEKMRLAAEQQATRTDSKGPVPENVPWVNKGRLGQGTASAQQVAEIKGLLSKLFTNNGQIFDFLAQYNVKRVAELSEAVAGDVQSLLLEKASQAIQGAAAEKLAASEESGGSGESTALETSSSPSNSPDDPNIESTGEFFGGKQSDDAGPVEMASDSQVAEIKELLVFLFASNDEIKATLAERGVSRVAELTAIQAAEFTEDLKLKKYEKLRSNSNPASAELATADQVASIKALFPKVFANNEAIKLALGGYGVEKVADLTQVQANRFYNEINSLFVSFEAAGAQSASDVEAASGGEKETAAAPQDASNVSNEDYDISRAELEQIKFLCGKVGWDAHDQVKWLNKHGIETRKDKKPYRAWPELKSSDAQTAIKFLSNIIDGFSGGVPGN